RQNGGRRTAIQGGGPGRRRGGRRQAPAPAAIAPPRPVAESEQGRAGSGPERGRILVRAGPERGRWSATTPGRGRGRVGGGSRSGAGQGSGGRSPELS